MAYLLILAAILLWSSLGFFVRISGVPVHVIIFYSALFSLFFQGFLFTRERFRRSLPPASELPLIFLLALCSLVNTFTFFFSYAATSIANAVLTHYIAPIIVAVLAVFFLKEKITARIVLSLAIASGGLWIMLSGPALAELRSNGLIETISGRGFRLSQDTLGIASGLISGIAYAVIIILIRIFTRKFDPYILVFIQNSFIVLLLLPFVRMVPWDKMGIFILMGFLHSTAAPFLYYRGLRDVQASRAAILGYFEPVGAIMTGILMLHEWPDTKAWLGGFLILVSGVLTITQREAGK